MTRSNNGRFVVLGLVGATILMYLLGCTTTKPDFANMGNEGSEVRVYEVFGMDCPGCHSGLEDLVNKIPEVKTSKANWEKQQLQVVLHPVVEVEDDVIYEAIKQANFTPGKRLR